MDCCWMLNRGCALLFVETNVFIYFTVFKDQLIPISKHSGISNSQSFIQLNFQFIAELRANSFQWKVWFPLKGMVSPNGNSIQ